MAIVYTAGDFARWKRLKVLIGSIVTPVCPSGDPVS
jgi:hypothetical protein